MFSSLSDFTKDLTTLSLIKTSSEMKAFFPVMGSKDATE
jgi:hypothetical protein